MHCLLCHEKIPRLRAWTGKSEFCSDEHAELYKKQTMERLLVEEAASPGLAPALPLSQPQPVEPALPTDAGSTTSGIKVIHYVIIWKFMVAAIIYALALMPTGLSSAQSPQPLTQVSLNLKSLYLKSPAAV